jgi:hypothetical protein
MDFKFGLALPAFSDLLQPGSIVARRFEPSAKTLQQVNGKNTENGDFFRWAHLELSYFGTWAGGKL